MASQDSYLNFKPFGLDGPRFPLADALVDPAKTESRRPHVRPFLADSTDLSEVSAKKKAGCQVPVWPWEDICVAGVVSEASLVYARYLEEIGAAHAEGSVEEHMGIHGAAVTAEKGMASSQMEEPSAESSPALPIQFSWSEEVEAAVLGMVQGGNVVEDLSTWVTGGGLGEGVSRANMAELVWLRHCDPGMRETVVNWAATCQLYRSVKGLEESGITVVNGGSGVTIPNEGKFDELRKASLALALERERTEEESVKPKGPEVKCGGCGSKTHLLSKYLKAAPTGLMKGCTKCNTINHNIDGCIKMRDLNIRFRFLVMKRGGSGKSGEHAGDLPTENESMWEDVIDWSM
ncbi:hypothetical protein LCI18_013069 [Fusarium solani-melongenae]|uniref:Uncharacterized protein n=1 Tax=Fusarium solani subsp. cucurbitae TaxID=2747967 RepID=A0ACD3ZLG0_FUSSC|nr:hypothetical protein LCI18_013069 [Fusarium solani-melongenae]